MSRGGIAFVSVMAGITAASAAAGVLLMNPDTGGEASEPTPPADCFVSDEPSANGPEAPSDLIAFDQLSREVELSWADNSSDETCFVIEARVSLYVQGMYEVVAILPGGEVEHTDGPYQEGSNIYYRLYAATATARSNYSNEAVTAIPHTEPSPTATPVYRRGDLNCDGFIDARDSVVILQFSAGLDLNLPPQCPGPLSFPDTSGDGGGE